MIKFDEANETHTHGRKTALRLLLLQGYVPLNRVWFLRSSVLKRIYKFIIQCDLLRCVFISQEAYLKECEGCDDRYACVVPRFFPKNLISIPRYRKSSIKPPPGGLIISSPFDRGQGLFNLETTMVSVLHKEPRIQSGKAQV